MSSWCVITAHVTSRMGVSPGSKSRTLPAPNSNTRGMVGHLVLMVWSQPLGSPICCVDALDMWIAASGVRSGSSCRKSAALPRCKLKPNVASRTASPAAPPLWSRHHPKSSNSPTLRMQAHQRRQLRLVLQQALPARQQQRALLLQLARRLLRGSLAVCCQQSQLLVRWEDAICRHLRIMRGIPHTGVTALWE